VWSLLPARQGLVGEDAVAEVAVERRAAADRRFPAVRGDGPEAGHRRRPLPLLVPEIGERAAIGRPGRGGRAAAAGGQFAAVAARRVEGPEIGAEGDVLVRLAIGDERDPTPVRRPDRLAVVVVAARELACGRERRPLGGQPGQKKVATAVIEVAEAIELVFQRGDLADPVGPLAGALLGALRAVGRRVVGATGLRRAGDLASVGRPGWIGGPLAQGGDLAGLATGQVQCPDLRARALPGDAVWRQGLRRAIGDEGEAAAIGRPARAGVLAGPGGQRAGRGAASGRDEPDPRAIIVALAIGHGDDEGDARPVRRQARVADESKGVEVFGGDRLAHGRPSLPGSGRTMSRAFRSSGHL